MAARTKETRVKVNTICLIPEPLSAASAERGACDLCGLWRGCRTPFIRPWVPRGWYDSRRILLIGEAPGAEEDKDGRPFVGRAGKLLRRLWQAAGYRDVDIALANSARCRPRGNAVPTVSQMRACRPFVLRTIEALRPNVVIGLGATAARSLTNQGNASVTRLRGHRLAVPGLLCYDHSKPSENPPVSDPRPTSIFVTYHPAAILHGASHLEARIVEDLMRPLLPPLSYPTEGTPQSSTVAVDCEWDAAGKILCIALSDAREAMIYEPELEECPAVQEDPSGP